MLILGTVEGCCKRGCFVVGKGVHGDGTPENRVTDQCAKAPSEWNPAWAPQPQHAPGCG